MTKNKNLIHNSFYNFKLRKRPSLFIGTYIIISAFLIQWILSGFITDASPLGFLTVNYLEGLIFLITILTLLFSIIALFFGNRKYTRSIGNKIWNRNSKKMMWLLFLLLTILYILLFYLLRIGEEIFIIPTFIIYYGLIISLLNFSRIASLYFFSIAIILIGFLPLFINQFGFYSLFLLGIAHYIFAFNYKEIT